MKKKGTIKKNMLETLQGNNKNNVASTVFPVTTKISI